MGKARVYLHGWNVGVQDAAALSRVDLERMRLAAETQTNLMPLAVGPGFMRPGLEYIGTVTGQKWLKEFVFGATDAAVLMFGNNTLNIWIDDVLLARPSVSTTVTSGAFSASAGWTLTATDGATSTISGGFLNLTALARGSTASATQTLTVAALDQGVEHAFRIIVDRGPVTFKAGSTSGAEDLIEETELRTGEHSLAFTPSGASVFISFKSDQRALRRVNSITIESAGTVTLPTPWAIANHPFIRGAQSADVVFVACRGIQPQRIERRSERSWSVVVYQPEDGPFTVGRTRKVKLKSSVTEGDGTLTADNPFFTAAHVGSLFRMFNEGYNQTYVLGSAGVHTDPIRVTGIHDGSLGIVDRDWRYTITGTWTADIWNQRSFDEPDAGYIDFLNQFGGTVVAITASAANVLNRENDDNAIIYYRMGIKEGGYTSGSATININYQGGGGYGICRVVGYTSPTVVDIEVISPFKNVTYTDRWQEGYISASQLWPSAVAFSDGRLIWSGEDRLWASVSDAFDSFDEELEGESAPINRSIATGGVNDTQWLTAPQRLLIGTEGTIAVVKSSSLDEPLTNESISIRDSSTTGAGPVDPARVDNRVLFADRSGKALYELVFDGGSGDYSAGQVSKLTTDIFASGIKQIAVQRRPDTRVWVLCNDGSCVCILYEPQQEVLAFVPMETDGSFESVAVIPGSTQDLVYFIVARTVGGVTVRFYEKMALDSEMVPDTYCNVADSFVRADRMGVVMPPAAVVNVGTHLAGRTVVAWADGAPVETSPGVRATMVVSGAGNITMPYAVTEWMAGLPYRMRYKSARLAYGIDGGTAMLAKQAVEKIGLVMSDVTRNGVLVGTSFEKLHRLPEKVNSITVDTVTSGVQQDEPLHTVYGQWETDSRVCLEVNAPYTAKFLGLVLQIQANG